MACDRSLRLYILIPSLGFARNSTWCLFLLPTLQYDRVLRVIEPSQHLSYHSPDLLQSPFPLWTNLKLTAFHVFWYVVWGIPPWEFCFQTQRDLPSIVLLSLSLEVQDATIRPLLWLSWNTPDHYSSPNFYRYKRPLKLNWATLPPAGMHGFL